jgi:hypothetical protein
MLQDLAAQVRVYKLCVPTATSRWHFLVILALGVTVGYTAAFLVILISLGFLFDYYWLELPAWGAECALVGASVGIVAWVLLFHWFRHWNAMRSTRLRTVRLQRLVLHPEVVARLPHRCVEHHLRTLFPTRRRLGRLMESLSPTHAFVIEPRGGVRYAMPVPCEEPFEPINLAKDVEQAAWIAERQTELLGLNANSAARVRSTRRERVLAALAGWWFRLLTVHRAYTLLAALAALALMMVSLRNHWLTNIFALAVTLPSALALLADDNWWLVPGGLVTRAVRVWRRAPRVQRYTRGQTPLLLDCRGGDAFLLGQGKVRRCHVAGMWWVVLAGWISTARRPSDDEIESFLGIRSS